MAVISDKHDAMIGLNNAQHAPGFNMANFLAAVKARLDADPAGSQKSPVDGDYKKNLVLQAALRVRNQGL